MMQTGARIANASQMMQNPGMSAPFDYKSPDYSSVMAQRADRLKLIRSDPQLLAACHVHYREHPWDLVNDWGMTFNPKVLAKPGRVAVMPFVLFPRQLEWMQWTYDNWRNSTPGLTVKSRECGVSWCAVSFSCVMCGYWKGFVAGFGSRKADLVDKLGDPDSLIEKARLFMRMLPVEFRSGWVEKEHSHHMKLRFPHTGAILKGESGDDIGRGGRTSIYFVDEAAHLERPQLVDSSLSATTDCRQDISSVNGMANSFAQRVHRGTVPVFVFNWRQDPRKDDEWYAKQRRELPEITVNQEIDMNWVASAEGVIIPGEWVQAAVDAHLRLKIKPTGLKFAALDVADQGIDKNAYAGRRGILLEHVEDWSGKGSDLYATVERGFALCDAHGVREMDYDGDGLGAGCRGDARRINADRTATIAATHAALRAPLPKPITVGQFRGSESPLFPERKVRGPDGKDLDRTNEDMFANRKAQAWWALRFRFEQTHRALAGHQYNADDIISISSAAPKLPQLISELSQPVYLLNNAGKILVDKQPDGVPSPNKADAVMMCYAPRRMALKINAGLLED